MASNVLNGLAGDFPFYWKQEMHANIARQLAGRHVCSSLGIHPSGLEVPVAASGSAPASSLGLTASTSERNMVIEAVWAGRARMRLAVYWWVAWIVWASILAEYSLIRMWTWSWSWA